MKDQRSAQNRLYIGSTLAALAVLLFLPACQGAATTAPPALATVSIKPADFAVVTADGIQVAEPLRWQSQEIAGTIYAAFLTQTIRITVAAQPAQDSTYYQSLVSRGDVQQSKVNGLARYQNDYFFTSAGEELVSRCCTLVNGTKACHIMFLCDVSVLDIFAPVFEYIVQSVCFV